MQKEKILVVDDDKNICDLLRMYLEKEGYTVVLAHNGVDAVSVFGSESPDLVLLDIMLPQLDGWQVCREIRKTSETPIIMVTAKDETFDKVLGLELGADDYVTKPFSPSELAARVDAICRRISAGNDAPSDILKSGPFTLSLLSRTLTKNGKIIDLTQVEFQLMELFMSNAETALERKQILVRIWGESYNGDDKIVDVNIRRLRMKIEDEPSNPAHLQTVWGYGYKWMP